MLQTAKGALDEDVSLLNRMIELLEYCNNGTIVEEDKEQILLELNALTEEIDRIAETVQFNGQYILNQDKTIKAYYGTKEYQEIYMEDFSSSTLNLNIDISSEASIQTSMTNVENALTKVGNKIKELETSNTFFENKNTELSEKAEALNSYTYLDNIELAQLQQDGELESDKIAEIDATLTSLETTINIIQTAEGSANEIHGKLQRMKELAVQGTNDTNNDDDRIAINNELNTLKNEIDEIVNNTNYGGTQLLDGTYHQEIVIGLDGESITLTIDNCNTDCLGENNTEIYIDVSSVENAEKTSLSVDEAIKKISNMRAKLGANQNRLQYTSNYYLNLKNVLNNKIENEETKSLRMALVRLEEMQSCFSRVRELMIQIQAPPNSEQDRISCFYEVEALLQECDRIANHTKNKETNLLNGEYDVNINVTNSALGIDNITLDTVENTVGQIEKLEEVIKKIFQLRKELAIKEGTYTPNEYTIDGKWADKLKIVDGKLVYIGTDEKEKKWAEQIGIQVGY